jgi:amidophosphoribosyltransferase
VIKNRYIGRTFIQPDQRLRRMGAQLKYNPLTDNLRGRRVVLVDDSIVRGNTAGPLVRLLRDGGASEVHLRISSPPVRHPCYMGVDMPSRRELIAHRRSQEEVRRHTGADTLAYLSLEGMMRVVHEGTGESNGHCHACFSGDYPCYVEDEQRTGEGEKLAFEGISDA